MTNYNALVEHVQEFCEQVKAIEELFGLKIVVDHNDETLMLVSTRDEHTPIAWLGRDDVECVEEYAVVDYEELSKVIEPVVEEEEETDLEA